MARFLLTCWYEQKSIMSKMQVGPGHKKVRKSKENSVLGANIAITSLLV